MRLERVHGILGSLWILNFVLLGLLIAPINDGAPMLITLGLWAVPTCLLALLTWRQWHPRQPGKP